MNLEWEGMRGSVLDDVFFTEGPASRGDLLGRVEVQIHRQNANLEEVKRALATQVRARGGNLVAEFRYGQEAHKWYQRFRWDEESWVGQGVAYRLA